VWIKVADDTFAVPGVIDEAELPLPANNGCIANAGEMKEDVDRLSSASSGVSTHVETKLAVGRDGGDVGGPVLKASGIFMSSVVEVGMVTEVDFGVFAGKPSVTNTFAAIGFAAFDKRCEAAFGDASEVAVGLVSSDGAGRTL
jgi:hypothetical protein